MKEKKVHNWTKVSLLAATIVLYVICVIFNILASTGNLQPLFRGGIGNTTYTYKLDIIPVTWVFPLISSVLIIYQATWLVYASICLFRRTVDGDYLYRKFDFINFKCLIGFAMNNLAIIAWLFLWDRNIFVGSLIFMIIGTVSLEFSIFISFRKLFQLKYEMFKAEQGKDVWLNRFLVQNGLAFFITWLSLATILNFALFLIHEINVPVDVSCTVALVIILVLVVVYFVIENFLFQRYFHYITTPWIVLLVSIAASFANNWNPSSPTRNNILTLLVLIVVILLAIGKMITFTVLQLKLSERLDKKNWLTPEQPDPFSNSRFNSIKMN